MIIRQKDIDALRDKLKIGDKVKYQTEVIDVADFNRCVESYVVGISASEGTLEIHIINEI